MSNTGFDVVDGDRLVHFVEGTGDGVLSDSHFTLCGLTAKGLKRNGGYYDLNVEDVKRLPGEKCLTCLEKIRENS